MSEWNLSDKIHRIRGRGRYDLASDDVKEFILKLKEEINIVLLDVKVQQYRNKVFRDINKLAGEKLI